DLRDRGGLTQCKFNPDTDPKAHELARSLRHEDVIAIRGEAAPRGAKNVNPKMPTGEIEVNVHEIDVLSRAETPPFEVVDDLDTNEETRLERRYLDLRRAPVDRAPITPHRHTKTLHHHLYP